MAVLKRILIISAAAFGLMVILLVGYYLVFLHVVRVPTGAMANTILPGDHVVVRKRAIGDIKRGDVIIFTYADDQSTHFISRVIGLPSETIQIRGRQVLINGKELPERKASARFTNNSYDSLEVLSSEGEGPYQAFYLASQADAPTEGPFASVDPFRIPDGQYFVMGDNRDNSQDSRFRGPILRQAVFGKATMIYWSLSPSDESIRTERMFRKIK
jgi:signal peptidase I